MDHNAFLNPVVLQDTPRLFTAIAEWLAVFLYFLMYKRRLEKLKLVIACIATFLVMAISQYIFGLLNIWFWIPTMILAVAIMYFSLLLVLNITPMDCGAVTVHAFVLAEFSASLYRQLYVWFVYITGKEYVYTSFVMMALVYAVTYYVYFSVEKENMPIDGVINISRKELMSIAMTGIGAFIMGNLSFVNVSTPFTATDSILYVRTLVDFGGIMMLMTQAERKKEMTMKAESYAVNQLFTRQYEQYKLAVDNSELLRREMHDMKHYVAALKEENDPKARAEILENMEQAISIQQSFMDTGNQVLDVILTTKSLQCAKQGITLNCMADGEILAGIHVKDICSLFGNVLDNAIEATQQVEDKDKRLITLDLRKRNQFIIVECENYSGTSPISEEGNLPKTTKGDGIHHGYGLKSIKKVAEKYGGAMNISTKDGWFKVKILLSVGN